MGADYCRHSLKLLKDGIYDNQHCFHCQKILTVKLTLSGTEQGTSHTEDNGAPSLLQRALLALHTASRASTSQCLKPL